MVFEKINSLERKKWIVRLGALIFTVLCSISLSDVGEPRSFYFTALRGLGNSLFLNMALIFCALKTPGAKYRHLMALLILLSGIGVFIIIPYGWTVAVTSLLFHLWIAYELIFSKRLRW